MPEATVLDRPTTLPERDEVFAAPVPRTLGDRSGGGAKNALGALATSASVTLLLFGRLAPFTGLVGSFVVAYVLFLATYAVLVSLDDEREVVVDRLMTMAFMTVALLVCASLASILVYVFGRGSPALRHLNFFTQDLSSTGPKDPLTKGGVVHAIIGTLWIIAIALVITVPLGISGAVYLNESRSRFSRFVRTIVEAMTALPSIVAGLFIYAAWLLVLGQEQAALAGALAISVDMIPIMIRSADVILRLFPGSLREASEALGAPRWRTARHVVLPTVRSGLATSVILAAARGLGETAPILLTVGYTKGTNTSPLHGPMVSLPLAAFELVRSGEPLQQSRGFGAAATLLIVVLGLFTVARLVGGRGPGHLSPRQQQKVKRESAKVANRIIGSYGGVNGGTT